MKTMKSKLAVIMLALILSFILASSFIKQEASGDKYLTMQTFESFGGRGSRIIVVYEDGKTEVSELDKWNVDEMEKSLVKINAAINNISNKGYELISSKGSDHIYIYTFKKK